MIPWRGYPSKIACVRALVAEKLTLDEIVGRSGLDRHLVQILVCQAKSTKARKRSVGRMRRVDLDVERMSQLDAHGTSFHLSGAQLGQRLLERIVDHGLIDALLNDPAALTRRSLR